MTVDTDIFRRAGVDSERDEQARRAVVEGRKLLPTLTSYARNLSKDNSVQVVMATRDNGSTDGKKIFWRPPIALGDRTPHERRYCDRRGPDGQLLCHACLVREDVLVVIYHEIAHIAFDSFAEVSDKDKVELISKAIESTGGRYAKAIQKRIEAAPYWTKNSYISLASLVSEFLPLILNALEDARVNREMFKARKGTKVMFDANCVKIFNEGVEQIDPATGKVKVVKWYDYPLNLQAIVGLFAMASGYEYSTWFRPNVVEALNDRKLGDLVNQLATTRTAAGVYHLSFPVLARLRELGFCQLPDDPEPEPEPDEEDTGGDSDTESSDDSARDEPCDSDPSEDEGPDSEGPSSDDEPVDSDGGAGPSEEPDPTGSGGAPEADEEESSEDAGAGSGGAGDDPDAGEGSGESTSEAGDASSNGDEDDSDDDESGNPGSMGADGEPEEMGDTGEDADDQGTDSDGDSISSGSSPSGEDDSTDADEDAESDGITGTGDIEGNALDGERDDNRERDVDDRESSASGSGAGDSSDDSGGRDGEDDLSGDPTPPDSADRPADTGDSESSGDADNLGDPDDGDEAGSDDGDLEPSRPEDSDETIDSGADEGLGGTEVVEDSTNDDLPMGTPDEAKAGLLKLGDHEPPRKVYEEKLDDEAIDRAIVQGLYFETPSRNIFGVREHRANEPVIIDGHNMSQAWDHAIFTASGYSKSSLGISGDFDPPESVLGPALLRMRVAFSDNKRAHDQPHLKSGRVNGRVLGKRAWADDERLFRRRIQPGKRDYFVILGMDISGSTVGTNIQLEKRAVMAQAELCSRMGITFAIYGHSGNYHSPLGGRSNGLDLDIYMVKEPNDPWNGDAKQRLRDLGPDSANLDGHTLEYYRKICDRRTETNRIIMYYTDGKMPAENHDEELNLLQREIKYCKQRNYLLLGVGIRTDSPVRHGLDTVQVNDDADVAKVVRHLEKRLSVHV